MIGGSIMNEAISIITMLFVGFALALALIGVVA